MTKSTINKTKSKENNLTRVNLRRNRARESYLQHLQMLDSSKKGWKPAFKEMKHKRTTLINSKTLRKLTKAYMKKETNTLLRKWNTESKNYLLSRLGI